MTLKDFLNKVNISDYIVTAERDGSISDVYRSYPAGYKNHSYYLDMKSYNFAYLPLSQEIRLTAEGIVVKDANDNEIELRFYRRKLVNVKKLIDVE